MSHTVVFKNLRGANFLRFGNEEFVFNFYEGVVGLMGENGLGKSAILDAVCICLFNETYRKSTQSDWTNNINGSGLYLGLTLETHGATVDKFYILRKPTSSKALDKLSIYKNDVLLTGITNYQEYIENTILGFGVHVFKNAIAVSGGTPFISMTPEEKRKFSDSLFSIKQVREYKKRSSEAVSELSLNKRIIEQEIVSARSKIAEYENVLTMTSSNVDDQIAGLLAEVENTQNGIDESTRIISESQIQLDAYGDLINTKNSEIVALQAKLVELNANEIYKEIARVSASLELCRREYQKEINESNRIAPNVVCKSCGNHYTEEQASEHKALHVAEAATVGERGKALKAELLALQESLPTIENVKAAIEKIRFTELGELNNVIYSIKANINLHASRANNLETVKYRYSSQIETLRAKEDQSSIKVFAENAIKEATAIIDTKSVVLAENERKLKAYTYIIEMCSDNGIKHLLLKEFMPILNQLIAAYLDKFDLPITVTFDEYFNHALKAPKGLGQKHSMMSKGQRTRINLAILFAVSDLIKKMGNVKCNLLMLDEFADEGIDPKGFRAAVESIRRVADRDNKSIVLVTHKQEDFLYDNLNALYELELRNSFSVLKEVKSF